MDRAPLAPRPENLPRREPIPCPTRCFLCFCPAGGFTSERFIALSLFHYRQQMRDLRHDASERRRIGTYHKLVDLLQAQAADDSFVFDRRADGTAYQFNLDCAFRHIILSCPAVGRKSYILSRAMPRISATAALSRNCSKALIVAFTTLCGLCDPMDLVSTFGMPTA